MYFVMEQMKKKTQVHFIMKIPNLKLNLDMKQNISNELDKQCVETARRSSV